MKKEIKMNKEAWNLLSKDHYLHYKEALEKEECLLNDNIVNELGDVQNKSLIHLQCNTGADTVSLVRLGLKSAIGVDLADQNIIYANQLKNDFKMDNLSFLEANVLELDLIHKEKYDIVFTSEGVLGWLPDIKRWAQVVRSLLKDDGYFYVYDSHPFYHIFNDELLAETGKTEIIYDYFNAKADLGFSIGGYAARERYAENYWWNHSLSEIINALIEAGLVIEYLHEFDTLFWDNGNMIKVDKTNYQYPQYQGKLPLSYSIKASVRK